MTQTSKQKSAKYPFGLLSLDSLFITKCFIPGLLGLEVLIVFVDSVIDMKIQMLTIEHPNNLFTGRKFSFKWTENLQVYIFKLNFY